MRSISSRSIALIKSFESCELKAYLCPAGVWTIGWGHTRTARPGMTITQAQADALLLNDLSVAGSMVERLVKVPLTDNQFGALVSFTFNVGSGNLAQSTLLKLLNRGWYEQVPAHFLRWHKVKGEVVAGLTRRRDAEAKLWSLP